MTDLDEALARIEVLAMSGGLPSNHEPGTITIHSSDLRLVLQALCRQGAALEQVVQWADAYPLDIFPEPDFKAVRAALEAAGITLDAVSASNMRHVVTGVGNIARAVLSPMGMEK